ncbi:MAG: hypothetical protein O7G86_15575, partial [Gammaproteobacteria bacterium]|nr:hypothetical protein [Gammaproteobacteria bacterium]
MLAVMALILAFVWLGNAIASMLLREPYSTETLQNWIPLSLMAYSLWHVLKIAWKRPEEAIEWSPAEREMTGGGPFSRQELLTYRLTAVMTATFFKALCASLLLFPDLPVWPAGFLGILLALAYLELFRMALEIATHSISPRAFLLLRVGVFGAAGAIAVSAFVTAFSGPSTISESTPVSAVELLTRFMQAASDSILLATTDLRHTWIGILWEAPFATFCQVITAPHLIRMEFIGWFLLSSLLVAVMARLVFWIDRISIAAIVRAERASYHPSQSSHDVIRNTSRQLNSKLPRVLRLGGMGPFVWRQMIGALGHKVGLAVALTAPALLSMLPLLQPLSPASTFIQVSGGLIFYSFLLLPAALKFDFRRDYDRLYAFKMLPVSPATTVFGQLATPVLLTSIFQLGVLAVTVIIRPVPTGYIFAATVLLLPLNVLIFSVENLIFLLYPYRLNQEGIEVFLRTILVFTAKGVFFAFALVIFFAWSFVARNLSRLMSNRLGMAADYGTFFFIVFWFSVGIATFVFIKLMIGAFRRYDPSLDAAG